MPLAYTSKLTPFGCKILNIDVRQMYKQTVHVFQKLMYISAEKYKGYQLKIGHSAEIKAGLEPRYTNYHSI